MLLRLVRHLLLVFALLAIAPVAASAACGDTIIDDYLDDGRVDGEYTQVCYDAALNGLDDDLREYTNAEQDIRSAKQRARNAARPTGTQTPPQPAAEPEAEVEQPQPPPETQRSDSNETPSPSPSEDDESQGGSPPSGGGGGEGGDDEDGEAAPATEQSAAEPDAEAAAAAEDRIVDTGGVLGVETEVAESADVTSDGPLQQALRDVGPTGGDDLPVPVLVLAGLAIALIAVGVGGIVLRRLQSR